MVQAGKDLIGGLFDEVLRATRNASGFLVALVNSIKNVISDAGSSEDR